MTGTALRQLANCEFGAQTVIHGDLCLSNILYDFRTRAVRVIDPRGEDLDGYPTIYGDPEYDLAKLYHSFVGGYDLILAGRYELTEVANGLSFDLSATSLQSQISDLFLSELSTRVTSEGRDGIVARNLLLFISMLPLHAESSERIAALVANCGRLFNEMELGQ